jgi:CO/xanthine dehydrogenase Mo-binding subunit
MSSRYFGARIRRNEDEALLTGRATFVDDVQLPGTLHAAFRRPPWSVPASSAS